MRTITLATAKSIAADWHGGQWSPLYAFGSSGILLPEKVADSISEINDNLNSGNILPGQVKRLEQLKRFITVHLQKL